MMSLMDCCKNGHPYSPENTYRTKRGRACKTCHRARIKRSLAKPEIKERANERWRKWAATNPPAVQRAKERTKMHRAIMRGYKLAFGCIDCGYADDPDRLHLDHRDPETKLFNPRECERPLTSLLTEWDKCDVRCNSCHSKRHGILRRYNEQRQLQKA